MRPVHTQEFDVAGAELDYLLFDWLSELLDFFYETRHILLCEFVVRLTPGGLRATVPASRSIASGTFWIMK